MDFNSNINKSSNQFMDRKTFILYLFKFFFSMVCFHFSSLLLFHISSRENKDRSQWKQLNVNEEDESNEIKVKLIEIDEIIKERYLFFQEIFNRC